MRTLAAGTIALIISGCAQVNKAQALPRPQELPGMTEKLQKKASPSRNPIRRITDGGSTYSLKGSTLLISEGEKIKMIDLREKFAQKGIDPLYAEMRLDDYPPKMGLQGKLLYFYSPGASGIVIASPQTGRKTGMRVSGAISRLRSVAFEARNGIIALSGPGADFLAIIGLGDLRKDEVYTVQMGLGTLLSGTGKSSLLDPRIEIIGNRVYLQDGNIGKDRYYFEVRNGIPLDIPLKAR